MAVPFLFFIPGSSAGTHYSLLHYNSSEQSTFPVVATGVWKAATTNTVTLICQKSNYTN